ncbi:hypothetical protein GUJ93_ZPchr0006g44027 [Zizania palustris]|uniref:Uncharacterized protein n=1 Tax=Zizania palustris TaxID=103762 RepID=A0A8J5SK83_ZIZPA|nr:hypothetical protein GUJ93_ZPchr0006g44027 [Zizania palustris]
MEEGERRRRRRHDATPRVKPPHEEERLSRYSKLEVRNRRRRLPNPSPEQQGASPPRALDAGEKARRSRRMNGIKEVILDGL